MSITSTAKILGTVGPCQNPENVENKVKTRSSSNDGYILIDQENIIAKSLDHGSKLAIGIRKRVSHAYACELPSLSHRQIPKPGLPINSRTPSPIKEKDSEISMEDSIFNLLEQIEDQIADFQADFAKLKRAYKNPATSITKPKSCPGRPRPDPTSSYISHRTSSSVALQLEAEILKLRGRLEKRVSQDVVNRRRHVDKENISSELDTKHASLPAEIHDAPTGFSRFEKEKIRMADVCEAFIGVVGFVHIVLAILYYFAKVAIFLFVML
ncbi:hypothetical protein TWF106_004071 [Orbilia oligospora]|uniref:Uncharacterized protein n=1 Tax=Orbilia oligospora TaxID=2813651 RepID=A0A7C8Q6M9_ORBOL|nr:hypothetical protein TWF106_004071 [Orbilia oligospora]